MTTVADAQIDVLIVGAGPVGLTLASLLRREKLSVRVLEAHPGTSMHPKARGISARSMETFRSLGLEEAVRAASLPGEHVRFFRGANLLDPNAELGPPLSGADTPHTPAPGALCSQDRLEPVLLAAATAAGADVRFGQRVTSLTPGPNGVAVRAHPRSSPTAQSEQSHRAAYVVGCDGARSLVREAIGIGLAGETELARFLSVRFSAPLGQAMRGREATSYFIGGGKGGFLAVDNDTEWVYQYPVGAGVDVGALCADDGAITELIRDAVGDPELRLEIRDTMVWHMDARIADTYRAGRVLLAGDAAHQTPPTGGHGMNVGIGDAETLAWQLGAVVRGEASTALLDRYTAERRPVGAAVIEVSLGNSTRAYGIDDELLLGTGYPPSRPLAPGAYSASAELGRRLPHAWLEGRDASSLDGAAGQFRVVTGGADAEWIAAVAAAPVALPVGYVALELAAGGEGAGEFAGAGAAVLSQLGAGDALLVRPDGHVAAHFPGAGDVGRASNVLGVAAKGAWLAAALSECLAGPVSRDA